MHLIGSLDSFSHQPSMHLIGSLDSSSHQPTMHWMVLFPGAQRKTYQKIWARPWNKEMFVGSRKLSMQSIADIQFLEQNQFLLSHPLSIEVWIFRQLSFDPDLWYNSIRCTLCSAYVHYSKMTSHWSECRVYTDACRFHIWIYTPCSDQWNIV